MLIGVSSKYANYFKKSVPKSTLADVWTKDKSKLSEKELITRMVDLAQRDAAAGKDSLHDDPFVGSEWNTLHQGFICLSSPDRLGIIQKKLSGLTGNTASTQLKGFDLFFMMNRRKRRDPDVNPDCIIFRDEHGKEVAVHSKYSGWITHGTSAEYTRSYAFLDLWNQALADAKEDLEWEESEKERLAQEAKEGIIFEAWA